MKQRWLWPVLTVVLVLLAGYQYDTIRQLRTEHAVYGKKVDQAFRYTAGHLDLAGLPDALQAFVAAPSAQTLKRAQTAAEEYTGMLMQLNDLRESAPPLAGGLQTGTDVYYSSTQAQVDMQGRIMQARLWPPLWTIGVLLGRDNWQLRAEDKQFLSDASALIRQLNEKLVAVDASVKQENHYPSMLERAKAQVGLIGPDLDALANRIKAHRATIPQ